MGSHSSDSHLENRIEKVADRQRFSATLLCGYVVLGNSLNFSEPQVSSGVGITILSWQDD